MCFNTRIEMRILRTLVSFLKIKESNDLDGVLLKKEKLN